MKRLRHSANSIETRGHHHLSVVAKCLKHSVWRHCMLDTSRNMDNAGDRYGRLIDNAPSPTWLLHMLYL